MEYVACLVACDEDPAAWARRREVEGWFGVAAGDHYWIGAPFPHLWVTLTQMALATSEVIVTSSFANNLFRSPVEFIQASLTLQRASQGRFEAGLGAGWSREELERAGQEFPPGPERARRYYEAMQVCRELLDRRACDFKGNHYRIDMPAIGPAVPSPPLVASVGGPWVVRHVAPLADRIELKPSAKVTRVGANNRSDLATVSEGDVISLIEQVRAISGNVPLGMYVFAGAGTSDQVRALKDLLEPGFFARFFGDPDAVAGALDGLQDLGIGRVQITEYVPGTHDLLASRLSHAGRAR
jgi:alkanesulfonate monooxygenase SsuD/methylene tetrahydromethanopterin reductase-like flavin-dependent oxidoreductase (luciferase family)